MIKTIRKLIRRVALGPPPSDLETMQARIEEYRRRGAKIGDNVRLIGRLDGLNPHLVTIGNSCTIGATSVLLTHCAIRGARPVMIEDEVWIGYGALILPGVTVGSRSVIGAGAVVTKDVPPRSIVAGNPAKVLRSLTEAEIADLTAKLRNLEHIGEDPKQRRSAWIR